jgi:hypothetical protein
VLSAGNLKTIELIADVFSQRDDSKEIEPDPFLSAPVKERTVLFLFVFA